MLYKKDTIDMSFVQCHYEEQDGYISIDDEYTNTILSMAGYKECDFQTMCHRNINIGNMESYALRSPMNSYTYAQYVLKGRFELGEPAIATDQEFSYGYARFVLKGRFELGENIIKSSTYYKSVYEDYFNVKL